MPKVSVLICCANSAGTLPAALASVRWADEVVVVDSGSEDETGAIASAGADVYVVEPWRGYTAQKQFGVELARHDWVFILDGDEEVSPRLAEQIEGLDERRWGGLDVVAVRRQNWVLGRRVRAWFPDWQARLIHRRRAVWEVDALHDTCHPREPGRGLKLSGHL
ncbi:MAG: glycosyltransferase family 2 protein, partial [Planctomycetota bacterium]